VDNTIQISLSKRVSLLLKPMIDPQKTVGDKARPLQNIHEDIDIGAEHIVRNNKQCIYSYAGRNCLLDLIFINCNWVVTRWQ